MRKMSKIIAATLLIAVVLSCFGIFSIFAEEAAADASDSAKITTLYDQSKNTGKLTIGDSEVITDKDGSANAMVSSDQKETADHVKYHNIHFTDGWSVADDGAYTGTKSPYVTVSPTTHYLIDGYRGTSKTAGTKDTDFLVIDLDVSSESNRFDRLYFQTLFKYGKGTGASAGSAQSGHYRIHGDSGEDTYVTTSVDTKTKIPVNVQSDSQWTHVTMVVKADQVVKSDGTKSLAATMYLYYNGQFVHSRTCAASNGTYLAEIRLWALEPGATPDGDNENLSIANFTIKSFGVGYSGELAQEKANLGNANYPLSSFGDLAYCLENAPADTDIATIERLNPVTNETETIHVTKISDLDGNLQRGDKVTLLRDITRKIVVPGKVEGEAVVPDVTFEKGVYSMVAPLALEDYDDLDWIIRDENGDIYTYEADGATVYAKGAQVYDETGAITTDTLDAYVQLAFPSGITDSKTLKFTFLKDTTLKYTKILSHEASHVTYDLNGKTLTIALNSFTPFNDNSAKSVIVIRDGKFVNNNSHASRTPLYPSVAGSKAYFIDADITYNFGVADHRDGSIIYIGCSIKTTGSARVCALKGNGAKQPTVVFDGCNIDATKSSTAPIYLHNITSSQMRYGSINLYTGIYGTKISSKAAPIAVEYYADESSATNANPNQNKVTINIQDSSLTSPNKAVFAISIETLMNKKSSYAFAEGFDATTTINIDNSKLDAARIADIDDYTAMYSINDRIKNTDSAYMVGAYTVNTNVNVKNSELKTTGSYLLASVVGASKRGIPAENITLPEGITDAAAINNGATNVTLGEGVKLAVNSWAGDDNSPVNVTIVDPCVLARTGIYEGLNYIITSSYDTYTYQQGSADPVEFIWNKDADGKDVPTAAHVEAMSPTPREEGVYKYEWELTDKAFVAKVTKDFTLNAKSNLTLYDYFYYNLFIPAEQYDAVKDYVDIYGADGETELVADTEKVKLPGDDVTEYYKFQIKSISPEEGSDAVIKVEFNVTGAYEDTYTATQELSVLEYAKTVLKQNADPETANENSVALMNAVINYIATAQDYFKVDSTKAKEVIAGVEFATPDEAAEIEGTVPGVELAVKFEHVVSWLITAKAETTLTISYTVDGAPVEITKTLAAGEVYEIQVKAYDFAEGLTVSDGESTATISVAAYYNKLEGDAKTMMAAIYNYTLAADAYKG